MKNAITWFDIPTDGLDRAVKFYSDILGQKNSCGTYMGQKLGFFPMEGRSGWGLDPPQLGTKPCANGPGVYLSCEGILDEVIGRVDGAGGKIILPKSRMGDVGWIAMIMDSEENTVGRHGFK
jgi:predicted enzyme related to lactoylglutathione lyase